MKGYREKRDLHFALIPKVEHPWFDEVNKGAEAQARLLEEQLGIKIKIEYMTPKTADINEQNNILAKVAAANNNGVAIDPLDNLLNMKAIVEIRNKGIPIIVFDSPSPEPGISSVGNNFTQQGLVAAERLVRLIQGKGMVAVMQGFPSAPNHKERYDAQVAVLKKYPNITIVDGGVDNDDITVAK